MQSLLIKAPAKLNLGLQVLGIRSDGFHSLESVFAKISLYDSIKMELTLKASEIKLECTGVSSPADKTNIIWKAAELFLLKTGYKSKYGVSISLHKTIPSPGGLGGGSSDAAAVLLGLKKLTGDSIDLMSLGEQLGSDVPFFLLPEETAFVEGRGEKLKPVFVPNFFCVLVHSGENIPTPMAFKLWDELQGGLTKACNISDYTALKFGAWHEGKPFPVRLDNDFLTLLLNRFPSMAWTVKELSRLTNNWGLSGSGPTFYALFRSQSEAIEAEAHLSGKFPWVCRCQSR